MSLYPRKVHNLVPLLDEAIKAAHTGDLEAVAAAMRQIETSARTIRHEAVHDIRAKREQPR